MASWVRGIIIFGKNPNFLTNTVSLTVAILSARIKELFLSPVCLKFGSCSEISTQVFWIDVAGIFEKMPIRIISYLWMEIIKAGRILVEVKSLKGNLTSQISLILGGIVINILFGIVPFCKTCFR